jgi:chitin synthase
MSYQSGGDPNQQGHHLQEYPPSTYHMPPPRDYDSDEEQEKVPLNAPGAGPFQGPFDESARGGAPSTGYSLTETYGAPSAPGGGPGYPTDSDPTVQFGIPGRAPSPYSRADTSSTEAWRQRQAPASLRRYGTRKIRLQQQVLSIDYPVPSAIQNAIQAKYRKADVEGGSEEFTHMRCQYLRLLLLL